MTSIPLAKTGDTPTRRQILAEYALVAR